VNCKHAISFQQNHLYVCVWGGDVDFGHAMAQAVRSWHLTGEDQIQSGQVHVEFVLIKEHWDGFFSCQNHSITAPHSATSIIQ